MYITASLAEDASRIVKGLLAIISKYEDGE
jgi:hypothetical protein